MKLFSCLLLLVLCLVPPCVFSQSTSATISGGITDTAGNFITGASVDIANDETGARYSVRTNSSGNVLRSHPASGELPCADFKARL